MPEEKDPVQEARDNLTNTEELIGFLDQLSHLPEHQREAMKKEILLSRALQEKMLEMAERIKNGEPLTSEDLAREMNAVAEGMGYDYGVPLPDIDGEQRHRLVMAQQTPLSWVLHWNEARTWQEEHLRQRHIPVRNSWNMLGDKSVSVVETTNGPYAWIDYHAGTRMRALIHSAMLRSRLPHMTAEAELRAQQGLKERINQRQFDSYILNDVFPEKSERSGLHYFFRKGRPTLAISNRARRTGEEGEMRIIAALCFHPMGYYTGTHCGIMCPTDEVIAQLLMMRGDEHRFWKMSGQWSASDPRSGL